MPVIKSSSDLRNGYNDISKQCHAYDESVYITKNGKVDLAVMSIETYEKMQEKLALYNQIADGLDDIKTGNTRSFYEAMSDIRVKKKKLIINHDR